MSGEDLRSEALDGLTDALRERFGDSLVGLVFYGSCLRDGACDEDVMYDLMVVVDGYRRALGIGPLAALAFILPPNVYYLEVKLGEKTYRAKYAVISQAQLRRHVGPSRLQSYFWGRLSQQVAVLAPADERADRKIRAYLVRARRTFMAKTARLLGPEFTARELWSRGLTESYRTEFRAEKKESRATELADRWIDFYRACCEDEAPHLGWASRTDGEETVWIQRTSRLRRGLAHVTWLLRRLQGRILHVLRLIKATWTFDGGLDYILWKIERHSGVKVEVSERARRHPVLAGWLTLWRVKRKGGFR